MTKPNGKQKSWVVWKRKAEVEEFSKLITNLREEHDIKSRCCELCGKIHAKAFYSSIFLIVIHHNTEFETHNLYLICLRKLPFLKREKNLEFLRGSKDFVSKFNVKNFQFQCNYHNAKLLLPSRPKNFSEINNWRRRKEIQLQNLRNLDLKGEFHLCF